MNCRYCGTHYDESDNRCGRCGRRPGDTLTAASTPVVMGAAAPRLQPVAQVRFDDEREASAETVAPNLARAYQKSLFDEGKILTFPQTAPPRVAKPRNPDAAPRRRSRPVPEGQASLDFLPPAPAKPKQLGTTVESVLLCEFTAATPMHRAIAAGLDAAMVAIGYGVFVGVFLLLGGKIEFTKTAMGMFGAMLLLIGFAYGLCFAWVSADTPGMRTMGLRTVGFDGFPPDRRQRLIRFLGACASRLTVVGLLWGLADEENLSWQDHISRTFPTPDDADSAIIRRG